MRALSSSWLPRLLFNILALGFSLNPMRPGLVYANDVDRASDLVRVGHNLEVDKPAYSAQDACPKDVRALFDHLIRSVTVAQDPVVAPSDAFPQTIGFTENRNIDTPLACVPALKTAIRHYWLTFLKSKEDDLQHSIVLAQRVGRRIVFLVPDKRALQGLGDASIEIADVNPEPSITTESVGRNGIQVESRFRMVDKKRGGNKRSLNRTDLAKGTKTKSLRSRDRRLAIRPNGNGLGSRNHNNRSLSRRRGRAAKKTPKNKQPNYIRWLWLRGNSGLISGDRQFVFYEIDQVDVDVSPDGEVWVHLVGPRCKSHLSKD